MQVHCAADTRPFWAMAGSLQVDAFDARAGVVSMAVAMMAAVRFTVSLPLVVFVFPTVAGGVFKNVKPLG